MRTRNSSPMASKQRLRLKPAICCCRLLADLDLRLAAEEAVELLVDEPLDVVGGELDAELIGLLLPEHEVDEVAVGPVGRVAEVVVIAAAGEQGLKQGERVLLDAGDFLVLRPRNGGLDDAALNREVHLLDHAAALCGRAWRRNALLLAHRLEDSPRFRADAGEVVLDVVIEPGAGVERGLVHEPVGHDALEAQSADGVGEFAVVDLGAVDGAQHVALLALAAEPAREPVEEVRRRTTPLERMNMNMMNTVSTAKIAFWFRRKMLNGL